MSARETRKTQRLKDLQPSHSAKASKKMDAFVNRPLEDTTAVSGAVAGEPTLAFLASEMRAIRVSTQNIEQDTKEIKATVEDIEGKISTLNSRIDEAEERVAALEGTAHTSKQRIEAIQEEMRKLMDHVDDLDNRGRRCNLGYTRVKRGRRHDSVSAAGDSRNAGAPVSNSGDTTSSPCSHRPAETRPEGREPAEACHGQLATLSGERGDASEGSGEGTDSLARCQDYVLPGLLQTRHGSKNVIQTYQVRFEE